MYTFYSGFISSVALCSKLVIFLLFPIKYQRNKKCSQKKKKNLITDRLVFPPRRKNSVCSHRQRKLVCSFNVDVVVSVYLCLNNWFFVCLNYVSHVQSRLVSVNGFRLMVFDFVVVVVVYLWLIGLVKKFSLYISRFWFVLTLDDNFSLFFLMTRLYRFTWLCFV